MKKVRTTDSLKRTSPASPIPPQVATELLCTQTAMSNKERKSLSRARDLFVELEKFSPLGVQHRLDYRLQQRNWQQLCKWNKRATARRQDAQAKFQMVQKRQQKLGSKTGQPNDSDIRELLMLQQAVAVLDAKARVLDIFLEAVESEIARRQRLWESVKIAGAPEFAKQLKAALTSHQENV
jgi:hypothetical protein